MSLNEAETFVGKSIKMIVLEGVFAGHFGECRIHFIVLRCYFEGVEEIYVGERIRYTFCSFPVLLNSYLHGLCYFLM